MKKVMLVFVFFATACSSPPEAPKVDWKGNAEVMNSHAIDWQANQGVIKSDSVTGQWSQVLRGFKPENRLYDDAVFYAVAHSDRIVVETSESGAYFTAKRWLQEHGATGVIEYRKNNDNFGLKTTNIYVAR
ncbi:conjugal transfer protein [Salmonella enterica]|nr:conjugal transfer protein [Salmonella enterica]ECZ6618582.1 conjugal transfer protein [Salmonella enterica]EFQ4632133.1 conjugal transfer protein [Salmonella enterica]EIY9231359.1 conjugal transfer protein [Salmonella enterica]